MNTIETQSLKELEAEGDIAADYIEELLDICDFDGDLDIEAKDFRVYVSVTTDYPEKLAPISNGNTVAALQELTRLAVQVKTNRYSRLILDIAGSRDNRKSELEAIVKRAVVKLEEGAVEASLPPMSSYERKLVHDLVGEAGFQSQSRGEGLERHTVITKSV